MQPLRGLAIDLSFFNYGGAEPEISGPTPVFVSIHIKSTGLINVVG